MLSELEYLLKTHGDHEALSDQSSLRDLLTDLRRLADDLGLDLRLALADADVADDPVPTPRASDPNGNRPRPAAEEEKLSRLRTPTRMSWPTRVGAGHLTLTGKELS
jgi:hypothetical protein